MRAYMKKQVKNFILIASISTQLLVVPTLTALSCSKATKNEIQEVLNDVSKNVKVVYKNTINKAEVLSKNINKDNGNSYKSCRTLEIEDEDVTPIKFFKEMFLTSFFHT